MEEYLYFRVNGANDTNDMFHIRMSISDIISKIKNRHVFEAYTLAGVKVHVNGSSVSIFMTEDQYDKYRVS